MLTGNLGEVGATILLALSLVVSPLTLELDVVAGAAWREIAVFLALALGVWGMSEVGRVRGWSELTRLLGTRLVVAAECSRSASKADDHT